MCNCSEQRVHTQTAHNRHTVQRAAIIEHGGRARLLVWLCCCVENVAMKVLNHNGRCANDEDDTYEYRFFRIRIIVIIARSLRYKCAISCHTRL